MSTWDAISAWALMFCFGTSVLGLLPALAGVVLDIKWLFKPGIITALIGWSLGVLWLVIMLVVHVVKVTT